MHCIFIWTPFTTVPGQIFLTAIMKKRFKKQNKKKFHEQINNILATLTRNMQQLTFIASTVHCGMKV